MGKGHDFKKTVLISWVFIVLAAVLPAAGSENEENVPLDIKTFRNTWRTLLYRERDIVACPRNAVKLMGVRRGDVVVDINPGPGYWTFKLAEAVGPAGKVIGLQVCEFDDLPMDAWIKETMSQKNRNPYGNVSFRKSSDSEVVPDNSVDVVLVSLCALLLRKEDTVDPNGQIFSRSAAFAQHSRTLKDIYRMLKPGGKMAVIDILDTDALRKLVPKEGEKEVFFMSAERVEDVVRNYERIGFRKTAEYGIYRGNKQLRNIKKIENSENFKKTEWRARITFASEQFFVIFEKPK